MSGYVGKKVRKQFPGYSDPFEGTVTEYDADEVLWRIYYEDGDSEELEEHEVKGILLEQESKEDVPDGTGKAAAKKGKKKKQLLPQRARGAATALGGALEMPQGKRALHRPAGAAADRHAKKQKQDSQKRAVATSDQDAAAAARVAGRLQKRMSGGGAVAAETLTWMSGKSGQAPQDTAMSDGKRQPGPMDAAAAPTKATKTRSLQMLSAVCAPKESDIQSLPRSQQGTRLGGRPKKANHAQQQDGSGSLEKTQQEGPSEEGNAAEEFFIPLEEDQPGAEEGNGDGEPESMQEERSTVDEHRRGRKAGKRGVASGSAGEAIAGKMRESKATAPQAVDNDETDGGADYLEIEVAGIKRGAPTSGPLEGPTRFHNHVIYGGIAYIAGQTAADPSLQNYTAQTEQVLQQLDERLKAVGSSRDHILKATVLLKDIRLGAQAFNAVWQNWIHPQHAPARTTFQASLIHPDLLVEVAAIAAVPANHDMME